MPHAMPPCTWPRRSWLMIRPMSSTLVSRHLPRRCPGRFPCRPARRWPEVRRASVAETRIRLSLARRRRSSSTARQCREAAVTVLDVSAAFTSRRFLCARSRHDHRHNRAPTKAEREPTTPLAGRYRLQSDLSGVIQNFNDELRIAGFQPCPIARSNTVTVPSASTSMSTVSVGAPVRLR